MLILVWLSISASLFGQERPYFLAYLKSYPQSAVVAVKEPFSWETGTWLQAGGLVLVSGALILADEEIRDWVQERRDDNLDDVALVFRQFGEVKYILPAAGLTALAGYAFDSPKTLDVGLLSLKSVLIAGATSRSMQLLSQRKRPTHQQGPGFWNGSGIKWGRDSFPSGHATLVWSLAPIFASQYSESGWVAPLAYGIATLTSLSRIYEDKHWSSDVFVGAVTGFLAAKLTLKSTPRLQIWLSPQMAGLQYSL